MQSLIMSPGVGERIVRFVGDRLRFQLATVAGTSLPPGWHGVLRTNLGRGTVLREEVIHSHFKKLPLAGASWTDLPLRLENGQWTLDLPLAEVGFFRAKAYAVDEHGRQHWPEGADFGVTVQPDAYRTANTIYCAFTRLFGATRTLPGTKDEAREHQLKELDALGYTVIPPSGKLRDLIAQLPHIIDTLGCRIVHLLPVNPTPTTFARFGRFGSPYACQDLTAIDPALAEFDRRTSAVDQFCELTYAAHWQGARIFLDLVINHTGWGATWQEQHPEWYRRDPDGNFVSPGAWGVTWEDLAELEHKHPALWEQLAGVFLTWCRRGVDGFRCDAGYQVPLPAWQFIIARVRQEFPDALFLLEGLGGPWSTTEELLTDGGMQWAYSELFQNFSGREVAGYLDYALRQSERVGVYVHYSETHDNHRLAATGRTWSLLRNHLCALTSVCGGFGFTGGVEWLATEKVDVHQCSGLNWGGGENIVPQLARLNRLLAEHPCFFDGAKLERLSPDDSPVYALSRVSAEGADRVLVLINTDAYNNHTFSLAENNFRELNAPTVDLLGHTPLQPVLVQAGLVQLSLPPAACVCLADSAKPRGLSGDAYRRARAQAAWAVTSLTARFPVEALGDYSWRELAALVDTGPARFLAAVAQVEPGAARENLITALVAASAPSDLPRVVSWRLPDRRRVTLAPPGHWLLIEDSQPFRAELRFSDNRLPLHAQSIAVQGGHVACFPPQSPDDAALHVERYAADDRQIEAPVRFLAPGPHCVTHFPHPAPRDLVLLTNGRGGMARLGVDLGALTSKYDCALAANLHPTLPVDRHVFVKRIRVWVNADGFITLLNGDHLIDFVVGPPARWTFVSNAGDGRAVEIELRAAMLPERNTVVFGFTRPPLPPKLGRELPADRRVSLTIRVDIEDRNFHWETERNPGSDHHFAAHCRELPGQAGFAFTPAEDRQLHVSAEPGVYHPQPEWTQDIPHPVEQSRGQTGDGDAYSPGWFEVPLPKSGEASLLLSADLKPPTVAEIRNQKSEISPAAKTAEAEVPDDGFGQQLRRAIAAFVVRRDEGRTVIAGYPWFLDWGRDTLICARGLLAAGMVKEVTQLLVTFGRFEENGTLPNTIHGADASNRDTSDAPLWYGVVCEESFQLSNARAGKAAATFYQTPVNDSGRTLAEVLRAIADGYRRGTPNGIRIDEGSGLVWSPSHFTWMDTNYPAGTPREGYPIEIQVLWIRLLRQLARIGAASDGESWSDLADRAEASFHKLFWLEERGYFADQVIARSGQPAVAGTADNALRSNQLFAVSLGLVTGERARLCVDAALRHLVVPGALRSLAPLPVDPPLPIHGRDGQLLNHPPEPYWGRYEGDEDTRRKPAYHNGTAWTWTFPVFCEALAMAWDFSPAAVAAARAYLGSMDRLLNEGCLGQLPEIVDGDVPHTPRGCDAQAWSATEALRVWSRLTSAKAPA